MHSSNICVLVRLYGESPWLTVHHGWVSRDHPCTKSGWASGVHLVTQMFNGRRHGCQLLRLKPLRGSAIKGMWAVCNVERAAWQVLRKLSSEVLCHVLLRTLALNNPTFPTNVHLITLACIARMPHPEFQKSNVHCRHPETGVQSFNNIFQV